MAFSTKNHIEYLKKKSKRGAVDSKGKPLSDFERGRIAERRDNLIKAEAKKVKKQNTVTRKKVSKAKTKIATVKAKPKRKFY